MIGRIFAIRMTTAIIVTGICLLLTRPMVHSLVIRENHVFSGLPCVILPGSELTIFITPKQSGFSGVRILTAVEAKSPDIRLEILSVPEGNTIRTVRSSSDSRGISWRFDTAHGGLGNPHQLRFTSAPSGERVFLSCTRDHSGFSNRERPVGFLFYDYDETDMRSIARWFDERINPFLPMRVSPSMGLLLFLFPSCGAGILAWFVAGDFFHENRIFS